MGKAAISMTVDGEPHTVETWLMHEVRVGQALSLQPAFSRLGTWNAGPQASSRALRRLCMGKAAISMTVDGGPHTVETWLMREVRVGEAFSLQPAYSRLWTWNARLKARMPASRGTVHG